ncbi:MAG: hypothetical protein KME06_02800 [Kastovskya adunca ATA6-11-RM4]|nr:hypothetical protein [Kastovskya adunca ATA6-11-RM4]
MTEIATPSDDRATRQKEKRSLIHSLPTLTASLAMSESAAVIVGCDRLPPILDTEITTTVRRQTAVH